MVYRKRRRSRRSRKKSDWGLKNFLSISARTNGRKKYHRESVAELVETPQGQTTYTLVKSQGKASDFDDIITDTGGSLGTAFGTNSVNFKNYISNLRTKCHIRNLSTHPIFFTVYEICSKHDIDSAVVPVDPNVQLLLELLEGWENDMGTGASSATTKSGDAIAFQSGNKITSFAHHFKIRDSRQFGQNYKILKARSFKANPGDDIFWTLKVKSHVHNLDDYVNAATSTTVMAKRYLSKYLLVKATGTIGESALVGNDEVMTMKSDYSFAFSTDAVIINMNTAQDQLAAYVTHDDLTLTDYQAPTEHAETAQETG